MNLLAVANVLLLMYLVNLIEAASNIIEVEKAKDLKKTISTKTNLLVLYGSSSKNSEVVDVKSLLKSVDGSFAFVDCTNKDLKKLCKKALPEGAFMLKHFKDGSFNKNYDRQLTKRSLETFMRDPTGDIPFEEDSTSKDVVHLFDTTVSDANLPRSKKAAKLLLCQYLHCDMSLTCFLPFFLPLTQALEKLMRKEKNFLVMFYTNW
jgi:protein disulfide-isomerase A5